MEVKVTAGLLKGWSFSDNGSTRSCGVGQISCGTSLVSQGLIVLVLASRGFKAGIVYSSETTTIKAAV